MSNARRGSYLPFDGARFELRWDAHPCPPTCLPRPEPLNTLPHASLCAGFQCPVALPPWVCARGYRHKPLMTTGIRDGSDSNFHD